MTKQQKPLPRFFIVDDIPVKVVQEGDEVAGYTHDGTPYSLGKALEGKEVTEKQYYTAINKLYESIQPIKQPTTSNKDDYIVDTKNLRITYSAVGFTLLGLFVFWIAWGLFLNQWLGSTTIGSMWAKSNFDTQYYVFIQPDSATSKNYRVKGDISRQDGVYYLEKIYWDNGGYLTFTDCILYENNGTLASEDNCESSNWLNDDDGYERYEVRLDQVVPLQQRVGATK